MYTVFTLNIFMVYENYLHGHCKNFVG